MKIKTYLALGSNLENPRAQLAWAVEHLGLLPQCQVIAVSTFIETSPVGVVDQPNFMNAVVELDTSLSPRALLEQVLGLETQRKRDRSKSAIKCGPRTLDIDILLYGDLVLNEPDLIIPHPRMGAREFVLTPLYEIAPNLRDTLCIQPCFHNPN